MNNDLATDAELERAAESELLKPPAQFNGKDLWPYSRGSRALWRMVCEEGRDLRIYQALAFVWVHQVRSEPTAAQDMAKNVTPVIYGDLNAFRSQILFWRDELTDELEMEAIRIMDGCIVAEERSRVHVAPDATQKKMMPTLQPTSGISSTSSPNAGTGQRKKRSGIPASQSKI